MSNLNPQQFGPFLHGTAGQRFRKGQKLTVEGANKNRSFDMDSDPEKLYFTSNEGTATNFAAHHNNVQFGGTPQIYEVQPTGVWERDKNLTKPKQTWVESFETRHPLKVVKKTRDFK